MSASFGKKLVSLWVTTKMLKLVDNACLSQKKNRVSFFSISLFSGIATLDPSSCVLQQELGARGPMASGWLRVQWRKMCRLKSVRNENRLQKGTFAKKYN